MSWLDKLLAPIVQVAGVVQTYRPVLNLSLGGGVSDDPTNNRTNLTLPTIIYVGSISAPRTSDYTMSVAEATSPVIEVHGSFDSSGYSLRWPAGFSMPNGTVQTIRERTNTGGGAYIHTSPISAFVVGASTINTFGQSADYQIVWSGGVFTISDCNPSFFANSHITMASDANYTAQITEWPAQVIRVTSGVSLTATRNIVLPLIAGRAGIILNDTTGGHVLQVIGPTGLGATMTSPVMAFTCDGTNFYT